MNRRHDRFGRALAALATAFLLASALVLTPGPSLYAQSAARTPDAVDATWISSVWSDLGALWSAVWSPASTWLAESTSTDGSSTDDTDSTDTDTSGGFDPGGDGGLLDPDG